MLQGWHELSEGPFEQYIIVDNLYQGYLQTQDDVLLDEIAPVVYPGIKNRWLPTDASRLSTGCLAQRPFRKTLSRRIDII